MVTGVVMPLGNLGMSRARFLPLFIMHHKPISKEPQRGQTTTYGRVVIVISSESIMSWLFITLCAK